MGPPPSGAPNGKGGQGHHGGGILRRNDRKNPRNHSRGDEPHHLELAAGEEVRVLGRGELAVGGGDLGHAADALRYPGGWGFPMYP